MPIEIKELHIRINVNESGSSANSAQDSSSGGKDVLAESLEQVMEMIRKQKER